MARAPHALRNLIRSGTVDRGRAPLRSGKARRSGSDRYNSPGFSNNFGDDEQNRMLDLLTPHTIRREQRTFGDRATRQIGSLIEQYRKPVTMVHRAPG